MIITPLFIVILFVTILFFSKKIEKKKLKILVIIFSLILSIPISIIAGLYIETIDCYKREVTIKETWRNEDSVLGNIIYIKNDSLFNTYYSISYEKDTTIKLYLIDKENGYLLCELKNRNPEKLTNNNYYEMCSIKKTFSLFDVNEREILLTENYKGYKITYNDWHKNIRQPYNSYRYFGVYKEGKQIKEVFIDLYNDFAWDNNAIYFADISGIKKILFEDIINN